MHIQDMTINPVQTWERIAKLEAKTAALEAIAEALLLSADTDGLEVAWAKVRAQWQTSALIVHGEGLDDQGRRELEYLKEALDMADQTIRSRLAGRLGFQPGA